MGRGANNKAASAQALLYGRKPRGSGPRPVSDEQRFDWFSNQMLAGKLPSIVRQEMPSVTIFDQPRRYFHPDLEGEITTVTIDSVNDSQMEMNIYREHGYPKISICYDQDRDYLQEGYVGDIPAPCSYPEQRLLGLLSDQLPSNTELEICSINDHQLGSILKTISPEALRQMTFASTIFTSRESESEVIAKLAEAIEEDNDDADLAERIARADSFVQLVSSDEGQATLLDANRHQTIYLRSSLKRLVEAF